MDLAYNYLQLLALAGLSLTWLLVRVLVTPAGALLPDITNILDHIAWTSIALAVISPLAFLRSLDSLKYVSLLAIASVVFILGIVVFFALLWPRGMPDHGMYLSSMARPIVTVRDCVVEL